MLTKEEVMHALSKAIHPEIDSSLVGLGMIKDVSIEKEMVTVTMNLPFAGIPIKDDLAQIVKEAVADKDPGLRLEVRSATMDEEEREEFMKKAREKWKS
ncbi:MAG: DUF59 domain-containing protein [Planctomycetes bacterium]|nr:DUF59 domain-containing protein [Planctomycetota bacterium]